MRSLERNSKPCAPWVIKASTCKNWAVERDSSYHRLRELSFHQPHPLCSRFDVSPILFYSQLLQPPKYHTWHLLRRSPSQQTFTGLGTLTAEKLPTVVNCCLKGTGHSWWASFKFFLASLSLPPTDALHQHQQQFLMDGGTQIPKSFSHWVEFTALALNLENSWLYYLGTNWYCKIFHSTLKLKKTIAETRGWWFWGTRAYIAEAFSEALGTTLQGKELLL